MVWFQVLKKCLIGGTASKLFRTTNAPSAAPAQKSGTEVSKVSFNSPITFRKKKKILILILYTFEVRSDFNCWNY